MDESHRTRRIRKEMAGTGPATGAEQAVGERVLPPTWFSDQSFYNWRKRLAASEPVRFALVEANPSGTDRHAPLELILASGDRLRIASGADPATLRAVLNVLRERR
jgi:hypothetical protein